MEIICIAEFKYGDMSIENLNWPLIHKKLLFFNERTLGWELGETSSSLSSGSAHRTQSKCSFGWLMPSAWSIDAKVSYEMF